MIRNYITIICIFLASVAAAQRNDINNYFERVRVGEYNYQHHKEFVSGLKSTKSLAVVAEFLEDSVYSVRMKAVSVISDISLREKKSSRLKNRCVTILLNTCYSKDQALIKTSLDKLVRLQSDDFSSKHKKMVSDLLAKKLPYYQLVIKLAGFVNLTEETGRLQTITQDKNLYNKKIIWASYLALARMENKAGVDFLKHFVTNLPVDDILVNNVMPDLMYTKNREMYQFCIDILNSDDELCRSLNPDNEGNIICGYRVMEHLAANVKNFPVKLSKSGDLDIDDYDEAIIQVREWLKNNEIEIDKERY